jgi:hypothetical protein
VAEYVEDLVRCPAVSSVCCLVRSVSSRIQKQSQKQDLARRRRQTAATKGRSTRPDHFGRRLTDSPLVKDAARVENAGPSTCVDLAGVELATKA